MRVERRTFIFATEAFIRSKAWTMAMAYQSRSEVVAAIVRGKQRYVADIMFSNMATGREIRSGDFFEDPSQITITRGGQNIWATDLNPRASQRWVAPSGAEILCDDNNYLAITFEPAQTLTTITLGSYLGEPRIAPPDYRMPQFVYDPFRWVDGKPMLETDHAIAHKITARADKG